MKRKPTQKIIECLVPDLPRHEELVPYLKIIDENRWYTNFGKLSSDFKKGIIELLNKDHATQSIAATLTSSGTTALEIALTGLSIKKGAYVLVPTLTFPASATAIIRSQLTPLIADVDPYNWQLTPEIAYKLIKYYPISAVVPVAVFGQPVDIDAWDAFSEDTGIPVVVDAAGAFPAQKIGKKSLVVFSFHATKPLGIGEGGGVFVNNEILNLKLESLTNFGFHNGVIRATGLNAKLSEYHAAVGLAQLKRWANIKARYTKISHYYTQQLAPYADFVQQCPATNLCSTVKIVKLDQNAEIIASKLKQKAIQTRRWYCPPLHLHQGFIEQAKLALHSPNDFVVANNLSETLLGIPFHRYLSFEDIHDVVNSLVMALNNCLIEKANDYSQ